MKRLRLNDCQAVVVDVQRFFLAQLPEAQRARIEAGTAMAAAFFRQLHIPVLFTLERPLAVKGGLPEGIHDPITLEKDFFDLTKEKPIRDYLSAARKPQVILLGCETDVCILQSCLGLLELGHEVFVIEDLLFTSTRSPVSAAVERMRAGGAVVLSFKSLFHELLEAVEGSAHRQKLVEKFGQESAALADWI